MKGGLLSPSPHNRLSFPKEQKLSTIFIFKQDIFLQQHKDFYCYTRICSMILQNIKSYLGIHDLSPSSSPLRACFDHKGVHHSFSQSMVASAKAFTLLDQVQTEQWDQRRRKEDWYNMLKFFFLSLLNTLLHHLATVPHQLHDCRMTIHDFWTVSTLKERGFTFCFKRHL